jgi:hypothetical protein
MLVPNSLGVPDESSRFVIAASPLPFRRHYQTGGFKRLMRTSSDYVGFRDILQSFGLLYGFQTLPDILDPDDYVDDVFQQRMNLYCIGSPKVNRWTGMILEEYAAHFLPELEFRADPSSRDLRNVWVNLHAHEDIFYPRDWDKRGDDRRQQDFGLLVRGPHPHHDDQMILVLAGRSSLGTEACCRAITNNEIISDLRQRLAVIKIDLENHRQRFWAIVRLSRGKNSEADLDTLRLTNVEPFTGRK